MAVGMIFIGGFGGHRNTQKPYHISRRVQKRMNPVRHHGKRIHHDPNGDFSEGNEKIGGKRNPKDPRYLTVPKSGLG